MNQMSKALAQMVEDTRKETAKARQETPLAELKSRIKDAPPLISFHDSVASQFCLIAEVKQCSPSMGHMNQENVRLAPEIYRDSSIVKGISVLTNSAHFGPEMSLQRLRSIKLTTGKPVLRKDFITDDYEVYQARAHGADAILLMANVLEKDELARLHDTARELGMDVLFETHTQDEIEQVPKSAKIYGINCRSFNSEGKTFALSRFLGNWFGSRKDLTIDYSKFDYCKSLPAQSLKIAESGVKPDRCRSVQAAGFNAILVGTSLLIGPKSIRQVMSEFEAAILGLPQATPSCCAQAQPMN
ncbi:MAG: trpC [Verrucomicrobiales bacterium]|nr:trpC [Verrucomicrobiales bacterium]